MSRFHVAGATPAAAAGAALLDIRTSASRPVRLLEIGLFNTAATVLNTVEIQRATTVGAASTTIIPQAGDPADPAATSLVGVAWSTAPASTAVPFRRGVLPANIGAGLILSFAPGDVIIPISASIVVMNRGAAASGVLAFYVLLEE